MTSTGSTPRLQSDNGEFTEVGASIVVQSAVFKENEGNNDTGGSCQCAQNNKICWQTN